MDLVGDIQRQHRDVFFTRKSEDRLQHPVVYLPSLEVFGSDQHLPFVDVTGDVIVEVSLEWLLEILDSDGDIGVALVKILNEPQLVLMMFRSIVDLADEQGPLFCEFASQFIDLARIAEVECSR